mmetsp:Transcript_78978/g.241668  ORF Transcript_78978/g.241668 Transcript_78978/m.241668 type:complete len:224 (-) Transcript_78978:50-721(-)
MANAVHNMNETGDLRRDERFGEDNADEDSDEVPPDAMQLFCEKVGGRQFAEMHVASLIAGMVMVLIALLDVAGAAFAWWSYGDGSYTLWQRADGNARCGSPLDAAEEKCGVLVAAQIFVLTALFISGLAGMANALAFHTRMEWMFMIGVTATVASFVLHWLGIANGWAAKPQRGEPNLSGFGFVCMVMAQLLTVVALSLLIFSKRRSEADEVRWLHEEEKTHH